MYFKTSDIAKKTNIHPNTVRFYERIGLISSVKRADNGYRLFNNRHLYQVRVLRCIFLDEWPGENIRCASTKIIEAMKLWQLKDARQYTREYIRVIKIEYEKAKETKNILKNWIDCHANKDESEDKYNRTEASLVIGTTPETLRNWERNELIVVPRIGKTQKRLYGRKEIERLRVIYMLRQSKYSMSAIHRCLKAIDSGYEEQALQVLHNPHEEDIISTGDHWLEVLENTKKKAEEILNILDKIEK